MSLITRRRLIAGLGGAGLLAASEWVKHTSLTDEGRAEQVKAERETLQKATEARLIKQIKAYDDYISAAAFAGSSRFLITAGNLRVPATVKLWDLDENRELHAFGGFEKPVHAVAVSADGRRVLCGGEDGTVRCCSLADRKELASCRVMAIGKLGLQIKSLDLSPDGKTFAAAGFGKLVLHDLASGQQIWAYDKLDNLDAVTAVRFAPDGASLFAGGHELRCVEVRTGRRLWSRRNQKDNQINVVQALALSPKGDMLLYYDQETLKRLDVATQTVTPLQFGRRFGQVKFISFSPDGRLALIGGDYMPMLIDVMAAKVVFDFRVKHDTQLTAGAISPDGGVAALAGTYSGSVFFYDLRGLKAEGAA